MHSMQPCTICLTVPQTPTVVRGYRVNNLQVQVTEPPEGYLSIHGLGKPDVQQKCDFPLLICKANVGNRLSVPCLQNTHILF